MTEPGKKGWRGVTRVAIPAVVAATVAVSVGIATSAPAAGAGSTLKAAAEGSGHYFGFALTVPNLSNSTLLGVADAQFDMVTPGNEMKWDTTEPSNGTFNFGPGDQIMAHAKSIGARVRGHNLVWHSQLPSWVSSLPSNQVQAAMETHITTEVTHYKGQIYAWDVVNEPFNDDGTFRSDAFTAGFGGSGEAYIADALKTAHAADPNAKLYINDFNIEGENAKSNAMLSLVQQLKAAGAPIDGIGFESHFILGQVPSDMQANMARFAAAGVDVAVTELDDRIQLPASSANLQQQATDFSNVIKDCLGVSRCVGVTQWGIGDADSWIPGFFSGFGAATMFDNNYQPKPSFTAALAALGGGGGGGNMVSVTSPGNQTGTVGTPVSLTVHGTDSGTGQTLSFSATGLPAGLTMSSAGVISGTPTTAGTSSVTLTAKDGTGATGSAMITWVINPMGGGGGGGCHVTFTKSSEWQGGFVDNLVLTNNGTSAISPWTLTFTFPGDQKITNMWNATFTQSGEAISATGMSFDNSIAPGGTVSFGFQGTWTSNDSVPTAFSINGSACS